MKIIPYGEDALLVQLEQVISQEVHAQIKSLSNQIVQNGIEGVIGQTPAYASLLVQYDTAAVTYEQLSERIGMLSTESDKAVETSSTTWHLPVCYNTDYALDHEHISVQTGLSFGKIVEIHTSQAYDVYMIGFQPGFGYMGIVPEEIQINRLNTPRKRVPQGAVGIAGKQTGVYPADSPGGWGIIGQCPVLMFDPDRKRSSLLRAGDQVKYQPITKEEMLDTDWLNYDISKLIA